MTYYTFQQLCARYGFVETPLTETQFSAALAVTTDRDELYGLACDVAAGFSFNSGLGRLTVST